MVKIRVCNVRVCECMMQVRYAFDFLDNVGTPLSSNVCICEEGNECATVASFGKLGYFAFLVPISISNENKIIEKCVDTGSGSYLPIVAYLNCIGVHCSYPAPLWKSTLYCSSTVTVTRYYHCIIIYIRKYSRKIRLPFFEIEYFSLFLNWTI